MSDREFADKMLDQREKMQANYKKRMERERQHLEGLRISIEYFKSWKKENGEI